MRHKVSEEDKELLRQDKEWFDAFMAENYSVPEKEKKPQSNNRLLVALGAGAFAVLFILTLAVCLPRVLRSNTPSDMQPKKEYLEENRDTVLSNTEECNQSLQGISVGFSSEYVLDVRRCYDKKYNDTLFYLIYASNDYDKIRVYLYTNPDFSCEQKIIGAIETTTVGVFSLEYRKDYLEDSGLYTVQYKALTTYKGVTIYIEHSQLSLTPESEFFSFFEQTFQVDP